MIESFNAFHRCRALSVNGSMCAKSPIFIPHCEASACASPLTAPWFRILFNTHIHCPTDVRLNVTGLSGPRIVAVLKRVKTGSA
jgi:hypothetical protein